MITVPICFFFNHKIIIQAGVCFTSLLEKAKVDTFYDIYIFHPGDLHNEHKEILQKLKEIYQNFKLNFIDVSDRFNNAFVLRGIPNVTYYRLLVPDILTQYDKVIISDVDIIFNIDLSELYNELDLKENYIAAVKHPVYKQRYIKSLGCDPKKYVNCGFFVYNSSEIRKNNITNKLYELVGNEYFFLDQDIINIVCKDKITYISPKYNLTQSFYQKYYDNPSDLKMLFSDEEIKESLEAGIIKKEENSLTSSSSCIIHYNGANPWDKLCWRHDLWWEQYRKSIYFDHQYYYSQYKKLMYPTVSDLSFILVKSILRKYFGKIKKRIFGEQ